MLQPRVHTERHSCDPKTLREAPPKACKRRRSVGRLTSSELGKFGKLQADHAAEVSATNKILLLNRIQKVVDGVRTNRGTVCTYLKLKQEPMSELRSSRHVDSARQIRTPPLQQERVPQGKVKEAGTAEQAVAPQRAADSRAVSGRVQPVLRAKRFGSGSNLCNRAKGQLDAVRQTIGINGLFTHTNSALASLFVLVISQVNTATRKGRSAGAEGVTISRPTRLAGAQHPTTEKWPHTGAKYFDLTPAMTAAKS